jgi:energy-coupling factor transporter transmembrane protein EcfT
MKRLLHRISPIRKDDPPMKSLLTLIALLLLLLTLALSIAYTIPAGWWLLAVIGVTTALAILAQRIPRDGAQR